MNRKKWKKAVGWCLALGVVGFNFTPPMQRLRSLPETIYLQPGESQDFTWAWPLVTTIHSEDEDAPALDTARNGKNQVFGTSTLTVTPESTGTTQVDISLLGIIPLKTMNLSVSEERILIPGGQSIGVSMQTRGALVVGRSDLLLSDGRRVNPANDAGLRPGDVILAVEGQLVESAAHLSEMVNRWGAVPMELTIRRGDQEKTLTITPVADAQDGSLRLGVWVRDSTAGVGTLTYIDPATQTFGALGHAITDVDTGEVLAVRSGDICVSDVVDIQQGAAGSPGEIHGTFSSRNQRIGSIESNTSLGIYGTMQTELINTLYSEGLPATNQDQVHLGEATLLTTLDDTGVQEFSIRIIRLVPQDYPQPKSMVVEVTDPELLARTGGIVQWMSGSPIIQDGRIVGAVTHVFINDPTKGHGLYIDWMLEQDAAVQEAA